jgi:integrase
MPAAFNPAAENSRTSFLRERAIRMLYQALEFEPPHWRAFYKLMLLTGARRSEISDLKKANVLVECGTPYIMLRSERAQRRCLRTMGVSGQWRRLHQFRPHRRL